MCEPSEGTVGDSNVINRTSPVPSNATNECHKSPINDDSKIIKEQLCDDSDSSLSKAVDDGNGDTESKTDLHETDASHSEESSPHVDKEGMHSNPDEIPTLSDSCSPVNTGHGDQEYFACSEASPEEASDKSEAKVSSSTENGIVSDINKDSKDSSTFESSKLGLDLNSSADTSIDSDIRLDMNDTNSNTNNISVSVCDTTSNVEIITQRSRVRELEATVARLQQEVTETQSRLVEHDASAKKTIINIQNDMRGRLENLGRLCEENRKEKEAMVLKYAQAEQKTLEMHKRVRDLEGRHRESQREREGLLKQSRVIRQEKDRLQGLYENKCTEMAALEKELLLSKDSANSVDMKVKWHQNKLKEECERHKETKKKLEEIQKALSNAKEETETIRANCQQIIRQYQEAEEVRSNSLGVQLKQKEDELKQTQAENYVQQEVHQKVLKDLEQARKSARESTGELRTLRDKVKCLEAERMCQEEAASQAKERALRMKAQRDQLGERVRSLEVTATEAAERAAQVERLKAELDSAKEIRADLEAESERARSRETELLEFTQRLSDRNAALQAENLTQKTNLDELNTELSTLSTELDSALQTVEEQKKRLQELQTSHEAKVEELTKTLAEKTRLGEELSVMLEDERNEIRTLKKKHAANTKDLTRQIAALRRKLDARHSPLAGIPLGHAGPDTSPGQAEATPSAHVPASSAAHASNGDVMCHTSPTSSTSSLDIPFSAAGNAALNLATAICVDGGPAYPSSDPSSSIMDSALSCTPEIKMIMPDRQALIDKIVRLQRQNARHNEKMDFLQEHVSQLTDQLKRKNRLLQHFILREEAGSVTPEDFDLNKAALARKGGIMASVYSSHANDQGMTLDLSLEITRKLQAVLEDTLLKNITLKDNLNTLGEEISRLSRENRELQLNCKTPS